MNTVRSSPPSGVPACLASLSLSSLMAVASAKERRVGSLAQIAIPVTLSGAPVRQRQLDQLVERPVRRPRGRTWRGDLVVADDAVQAVAAQQEDVARLDLALDAVDLDLALCTPTARDRTWPIGWPSACSAVISPRVDHLLDLGVVAAELVELAAAHQIGAAVAGPEDGVAAALDDQHDHGRAHLLAALPPSARICSLAARIAAGAPPRRSPRSRAPGRPGRARATIRPEAHSPPSWPPMPSATAHRPPLVAGDIAVLVMRRARGPHGCGPSFRSGSVRAASSRHAPAPAAAAAAAAGDWRKLGSHLTMEASSPFGAKRASKHSFPPDKAANGRGAGAATCIGSAPGPWPPSFRLGLG